MTVTPKNNPTNPNLKQQRTLKLKSDHSFESLRFKKDAEFLIEVFLNYGDIASLDADQRQYVESIIKSDMDIKAHSASNPSNHRGVLIEKTLNAFESQSEVIASDVQRGRKIEEKIARQQLLNLTLGAKYLQQKLDLINKFILNKERKNIAHQLMNQSHRI